MRAHQIQQLHDIKGVCIQTSPFLIKKYMLKFERGQQPDFVSAAFLNTPHLSHAFILDDSRCHYNSSGMTAYLLIAKEIYPT